MKPKVYYHGCCETISVWNEYLKQVNSPTDHLKHTKTFLWTTHKKMLWGIVGDKLPDLCKARDGTGNKIWTKPRCPHLCKNWAVNTFINA